MASIRALSPRSKPVQKRALARREQILAATAVLLEEVGQDDLTTILVAKRVGVSVGTLYHYFPNKYAILYALAEQWLGEWNLALLELEAHKIESLSLKKFVEKVMDRTLLVYKNQSGIHPLLHAMISDPELKELNRQHHHLIIN